MLNILDDNNPKEGAAKEDPSEDPPGEGLPPAGTPTRLDPEKVRVVDIEVRQTGEILRRDCYDPDGDAAEMGDVLRVAEGELYVRRVRWARSEEATVELEWEATGLAPEDVRTAKVFTWPVEEQVRSFP